MIFRRLRWRAALLVGGASLLPLVVLGGIAVHNAHDTLLTEVERADHDIASRAAAEIEAHVKKYADTLGRIARTLSPSMHLTPEQAERLLKNYRLDVPDLRQLDYVGRDGREIATGRADGRTRDRSKEEAVRAALAGQSYRSRVTIADEDLVPEIVLAEPQRAGGQVVGAVVATIDLTEMWRVIDRIHLGRRGYARVVGEDGTLLAVGEGALKRRVFTREKDAAGPIVDAALAANAPSTAYEGAGGEHLLAVPYRIEKLGWKLILEQPMGEALAPYHRFATMIVALGAALLAFAAAVGGLGARSVVSPIERLRVRAGEIARGLLEARVQVDSPEELSALADAMNRMCEDLIRLQDDVRKKERIATLGRLAAGLAHDLKHPVRALQVGAKHLLDRPDDPSVRRSFAQVIDRELKRMESFLDDLKRVSRDEPINVARADLDAADVVRHFAETQRDTAPSGIELVVEAPEAAPIVGNRELLERVLSNLVSNAYEAMEGDGRLTLRVAHDGDFVRVAIADTGAGIPPDRLDGLFNDFATTKKRGLGLGLAVCRKIVADHGGRIDVHSEVGRGTEFVIRVPLAHRAAA